MKRLQRILRQQAGYTLIELITASVLLLIVLAGLGNLFVSSSNAEVNANKSFRAQTEARVALDRLRRDTRCATTITPSGVATTSITMTLPSGCTELSGSVTWCTRASGTTFELYRISGAACAGGTRYAQSLTQAQVFTFTAGASGELGRLGIDLWVDVNTSDALKGFHITESLVPRNATRT